MISKDELTEYFKNTRKRYEKGEADFNIDEVCNWSYFFTDSDRTNLTRIGLHLEDNGYKICGFLEPAPEDEDQRTLYIRADRIERHTVDSLHETNQELSFLAEKMGVEGYDGMDVGPIGGP